MAKSIGSLFVEYRATADQYLADLKRMAKDSKEFERVLKPIQDRVKDLGLGLTAVGGVVTTAFIAMTKQAANYGDAIRDASIRTGISTETLSGLKLAAEQTGTSFEAVTGGLARMSRSALAAAQGTKQSQAAFTALGVSVKDAGGHLRAQDQILGDVADKFSKMADGTAKAALGQQIFGKNFAQLTEFINQGRDGIENFIKITDLLGLKVGPEFTSAADQFNDSLNLLKNAELGLSVSIGTVLIPVLTKLITFVITATIEFRKFTDAHPALIKAVAALAAVLLGSGGLLLGLTGLLVILPQLVAAYAFLVSPAGAAALAIAGTTAAIVAALAAFGTSLVVFPQWRAAWSNFIKNLVGELALLGSQIYNLAIALNFLKEGQLGKAFETLKGSANASLDAMIHAMDSFDKGVVASSNIVTEFQKTWNLLMASLKMSNATKPSIIPDIPDIGDDKVERAKKTIDEIRTRAGIALARELQDQEEANNRIIENEGAMWSARLGLWIKGFSIIDKITLDNAQDMGRVARDAADTASKWLDVLSDNFSKSLGDNIDMMKGMLKQWDDFSKREAEKWQRVWEQAIGNIASQFANDIIGSLFPADNTDKIEGIEKQITDIKRQQERERLQAAIDGSRQTSVARHNALLAMQAFEKQVAAEEQSDRAKNLQKLEAELNHTTSLFAKFADTIKSVFADLGKSILKIFITDIFQNIAKRFSKFLADLATQLAGSAIAKSAASAGASAAAGSAGSAAGAGSTAGNIGASVGSGAGGLAAGFVSGGIAAAGAIVAAYINKGNFKAIEEQTRETRDWLEIMATAWNPLFNQMTAYQKGIYESIKGGAVLGNGRVGPGAADVRQGAAGSVTTIEAPFTFAPTFSINWDRGDLTDLEVRNAMDKMTVALDTGIRGYRERWAQILGASDSPGTPVPVGA